MGFAIIFHGEFGLGTFDGCKNLEEIVVININENGEIL